MNGAIEFDGECYFCTDCGEEFLYLENDCYCPYCGAEFNGDNTSKSE